MIKIGITTRIRFNIDWPLEILPEFVKNEYDNMIKRVNIDQIVIPLDCVNAMANTVAADNIKKKTFLIFLLYKNSEIENGNKQSNKNASRFLVPILSSAVPWTNAK